MFRGILGRRSRGRSVQEQHLIVEMVDAGCSYAVIRRRLAVPSAAIDVALRQRQGMS